MITPGYAAAHRPGHGLHGPQLRHLNIDTMASVAHAAVVKPSPQDVSLYRFMYASASSRLLCSSLKSPCRKHCH